MKGDWAVYPICKRKTVIKPTIGKTLNFAYIANVQRGHANGYIVKNFDSRIALVMIDVCNWENLLVIK